jgi:4-alpha-glucanotransferase
MTLPLSPLLAQRSSGVLLHITSLPGAYGSGDLGLQAYHFVDWLVAARQRLWQVLPLSPVGPGNSPYTSPASLAGNPLLIDLDELVRCGWLVQPEPPVFEAERCDFDRVALFRMDCLRAAWRGFVRDAQENDWRELEVFRDQQASWLEGYAIFMALEARYGQPWTQWPDGLPACQPEVLAWVLESHSDDVGFFRFIQWRFHLQWQRLRAYAHQAGVYIAGDAPIFVAHHSADVWLNQSQFVLDAHGLPLVVAGVPPDHFSATGQRWGNPLYRWDLMEVDGFAWWKTRLRQLLAAVDVVRLDHFRGFESYWEIAAQEPTAVHGHWRAGPGQVLFEALAADHARSGAARPTCALPLIAEDLGIITPAVTALRQACGFPGMRVLQFAFGDTPANPYLPHNYEPATVAYTGTHDNDTSVGWWQTASTAERRAARHYLGSNADVEIHWAMIHALSQSVANTVIFPLQDVLGLDGTHRMNTPGLAQGCWAWRFDWRQVGADAGSRLAHLTQAHGRNQPVPGAID